MTTVPWVCGACRSINQPRESRCYRCRTPRDLGEVDPEQLITAGAGSTPEPITRPIGAYRSSAPHAMVTQVLIIAALIATVVSGFIGADLVGRALDEGQVGGLTATSGLVGFVGLGLAAAALVAWAAWLSRVVDNVPKLGLGWPNVTPTAAIYESIFPGVNLYRVPSILRDVVNRLEPNGRGEALIAAAWLALVGGALAPRLLRLATSLALGEVPELARLFVLLSQLGLGLTVAGGALLVVLIQWIERRMAVRAAAHPPATSEAVVAEPAEPTRVQTIAEAAGAGAAGAGTAGAAAALQPEPTQEGAAAHPPEAPEPARPRWGGAVAAPTHLTTPPAPPPQSVPHPEPVAPAAPEPPPAREPSRRYGDERDDWLIGQDDSEV